MTSGIEAVQNSLNNVTVGTDTRQIHGDLKVPVLCMALKEQ